MSQNQEIIESKLCAYIDGELDPDGQAEIEKHLEANPQHRRLLESLKATRDLLKWLPREPAPADIAETLNAQLERSVLLDYTGDSLRISPWPRIFAAAAIIVLTAGLGAAVYFALPRSQKSAQLAKLTPSAESDSGKAGGSDATPALVAEGPSLSDQLDRRKDDGTDDAPKPDRALMGKSSTALADSAAPGTPGATAAEANRRQDKASPDAETLRFADAQLAKRAAGDQAMDMLAQQVTRNSAVLLPASQSTPGSAVVDAARNSGGGQNAVLMLVRSNEPDQTQKQLTAYFAEQQIQWRTAQLPSEQEGVAGAAQSPLTSDERRQTSMKGGDIQSNLGAQQGANGPIAGAVQQRTFANSLALNAADGSGATTQPAQQSAQSPAPAPVPAEANGQSQNQNMGRTRQEIATSTSNSTNYFASNNLIVCQMSRKQAEQLTSAMSRDGQEAEVKEIEDLRNYALNNDASAKAAPSFSFNQTDNRGALSERDTAREKAQLNKSASLSPAAPPTSGPALSTSRLVEASAADPLAARGNARQNQREVNEQLGNPSTQPAFGAMPTTAPAEAPVNVVIMVQDSSLPASQPAAAASPPATQPTQVEQAK